jgi:NADH dehydrogenase
LTDFVGIVEITFKTGGGKFFFYIVHQLSLTGDPRVCKQLTFIARMVSMAETKQHIVIVGGGFGGVKAAELLSRNDGFTVTLVSDRADFWYYPSLYRTATGAPSQLSSVSLVNLFKDRPVDIVLAKAEHVNKDDQILTISDGKKLHYDHLILALGVVTNYFGIKGLPEYSYGIKSLEEAEELKAHLHKQLLDDQKPDLNYIVVGGGATGIELAGQLPGYIRHIMQKHGIQKRSIKIDLVEAAPHLMPRMPKKVGRAIERRLRSLGIHLYLGEVVQGETADALKLGDRSLQSHTVIWTAGQANNPFFEKNKFAISDHHKVVVDKHLMASPNIYVIGDNAETQYSGMAQTAIYDAEFVAENLARQLGNKPPKDYQPKKPIYVTPAGEHWAYVVWGKVYLQGRLGWWLREAGDIKGFLDIETPIKAGEQWLKEFQSDDEPCATCGQSYGSKAAKSKNA